MLVVTFILKTAITYLKKLSYTTDSKIHEKHYLEKNPKCQTAVRQKLEIICVQRLSIKINSLVFSEFISAKCLCFK